MAKSELTKVLLAQTLKALSKEKPFDKISIGEITKMAGISRKTFYYHFVDKQDLVCWVFDYETYEYFNKYQNQTLIHDVVSYLYSEKEFYIGAIRSEVQNSLREHLYKRARAELKHWIKMGMGDKKLDDELFNNMVTLLTHAIVGAIIQWANEGMEESVVNFTSKYATALWYTLELSLIGYAK